MKIKRIIFGVLLFLSTINASALVVDRDADGFIEIDNLDDLNEIRKDITGRTFRGSSDGCPQKKCIGFELTRDLDFDTNKNGYLDAKDWNGGKAWMPLPFAAQFKGNGHSISNLLIATPAIRMEGQYFRYNYGFFDLYNDSVVENLSFISPKVVIDGSIIPSKSVVGVGVVAGSGSSVYIYDVNVLGANISYNRPSSLPSLEKVGDLGGVIGLVNSSYLLDVHFDGAIRVIDAVPHNAGGISGSWNEVFAVRIGVNGSIYGAGNMGGITGTSNGLWVSVASSAVDISTSGNQLNGGIVGALDLKQNSLFAWVHTLGHIQKGGGIIGVANTDDYPVFLEASYSQIIVEDNGRSYAQLIGKLSSWNNLNNSETYQIVDPQGVALPTESNAYTQSVNLSLFQCITDDSKSCTGYPRLGSSWKVHWDFGSPSELPVLRMKRNFPWFSTDTPGGSGDYEGVARLTRYAPQYTCENPLDIEVKEKKSGYVFNARLPLPSASEDFVFEFFNAKQGLKCVDAKQKNGSCKDFKVSYLCGGSGLTPKWTAWLNQDGTKNDGGDYEPVPSKVCSQGQPVGIRAQTDVGDIVFYGPPQIPKKFSLSKGFECENDANGPAGKENCKDYEVRMICEI